MKLFNPNQWYRISNFLQDLQPDWLFYRWSAKRMLRKIRLEKDIKYKEPERKLANSIQLYRQKLRERKQYNISDELRDILIKHGCLIKDK